MGKKRLLRAVVVTDRGMRSEGVILAIEGNPWHTSQKDAEACKDESCQKCHCVYVLDGIEFNFDLRRVHPAGDPDYGRATDYKFIGPIPRKDLKKFKADFGLYY